MVRFYGLCDGKIKKKVIFWFLSSFLAKMLARVN